MSIEEPRQNLLSAFHRGCPRPSREVAGREGQWRDGKKTHLKGSNCGQWSKNCNDLDFPQHWKHLLAFFLLEELGSSSTSISYSSRRQEELGLAGLRPWGWSLVPGTIWFIPAFSVPTCR
jgi:hypothetical protein